ncbi:MAG: hypothetical protein J0I12_18060 [Candidatus Eremiobacteraeota bacterium]|nr:hypothetical protein [Candidatus Eremiobacteraeota bacterium]
MPENPLLDYLETQVRAGVRSSSGRFTVLNLEGGRLPGRRLPRPEHWPLKVVQALVAAEASSIQIDCGSTATVFRADGLEPWTGSLQSALLTSQRPVSRALEHLRQALWSLADQGRPFWLQGLRQQDGRLHRWGPRVSPGFWLKVAHASSREPRRNRIFFWQSPARREDLGLLLAERARFCPVPLTVDGRRFELLQELEGSLLALGLCSGQSIQLRVPRLCRLPDTAALHTPEDPTQTSVVCCLHQGSPTPSRLFWMDDGVVVESETLQTTPGICHCSLFASAEGLPSRVRGLPYQQRFRSVLQDVLPFLSLLQLSPAEAFPREREFAIRSGAARLQADLRRLLESLRKL